MKNKNFFKIKCILLTYFIRLPESIFFNIIRKHYIEDKKKTSVLVISGSKLQGQAEDYVVLHENAYTLVLMIDFLLKWESMIWSDSCIGFGPQFI